MSHLHLLAVRPDLDGALVEQHPLVGVQRDMDAVAALRVAPRVHMDLDVADIGLHERQLHADDVGHIRGADDLGVVGRKGEGRGGGAWRMGIVVRRRQSQELWVDQG